MTEMNNFSIDLGADGIALVTFDVPGRSMNVITASVQRDLETLVVRIRDDPAIRGAVLRSGKASGFCAGADLDEMEGDIAKWREAQTQDELRSGVESAGTYSRRLRALETCGKPVAAVISGTALGGGLELALACHYRVASADPGLRLGLPESTIGLMPGGGGTQRLPRLMGLARAMPHLLQGIPISLEDAVETGVVNAVYDDAELLNAAHHWISSGASFVPPWDVKGYRPSCGGPHSDAGYSRFAATIAAAAGAGAVDHPSQANIMRAVYEGMLIPIDAGLRVETRYFFNTVRSSGAGAMVRTLFHGRRAIAKEPKSNAAGYALRLANEWSAACARLVADGAPPALVAGASRRLSPSLTPENIPAPVARTLLHLADPAEMARLQSAILMAVAEEAERCLGEGVVSSRPEAELLAIEAGYPIWTGGPLTYAASHADQGENA